MTPINIHDGAVFPVTFIRPLREMYQVNEYLARTPVEHDYIGLQKLRLVCSEIFKKNKATESRLDPNGTTDDILFPGLKYCGIRPYFVTRNCRHELRDFGPTSWVIATAPAMYLKINTPKTTSLNHYCVSLGTVSSGVLYNGLLEAEKQPTARELVKMLTSQARAKRDVNWYLFAYVTEIHNPTKSQESNYITVTVHAIPNPPIKLTLLERPFNTLHDNSRLFIISIFPPAYQDYFHGVISKHLKKEAEQRADALGLLSLQKIPPTYSSRHGSSLEYLFSPSE